MNKEQLAEKARYQYSEIRQNSIILNFWQTSVSPPGIYKSSLEKIAFENRRDREIKHRSSMISRGNTAARRFYKENHAELYELAKEEMEAKGIAFDEGDHSKVTEYYFGKGIADLERQSPLDAIGPKILQIAQVHIDKIGETAAA